MQQRICLALLFFAIAIGQATMEGTGLKTEKAGKKITVVACLVEIRGHFTLTDENYHSDFLMMTLGDFDMRADVGHLIRVKGRSVGHDGYVPIGGDSRFIGIKVESVRVVGASCDLK